MGDVKSSSFVTDVGLIQEQLRLSRYFGYLPVYASTTTDFSYGKIVLAWLIEACPGYLWIVEVRDEVVSIWNADLGSSWGFRALVKEVDNDGDMIKSAAHELLAQYGVRNTRADQDELVHGLKRDARGDAVRIN
ncbi:MAG: hypothetical protein QME44_09090 [Thermodesulfobacteriota bacterium]|nr:hypothetical protein [Thermodesulfobacteriota bacterium]